MMQTLSPLCFQMVLQMQSYNIRHNIIFFKIQVSDDTSQFSLPPTDHTVDW